MVLLFALALLAGVFVPSHAVRAFPTTGILDNFNRADEDPLANGNWSGPIEFSHSQLKVDTNTVAGEVGTNDSYWSSATFGPDSEAYITINTKPADGNCVAIAARLSEVGGAISGYWAEYCATAGTDTLDLYRFDSGSPTDIATGAQELSSGDSIGLEVRGSTVKMYYKIGAGSWTQKLSVTDSTYAGAGYIGLHIESTGARGDDFGGGTVVAGGRQVSSRSDTLSDSRPSATSNHTIAFTTNNSLTTTSTNATSTLKITVPSSFNLSNIFCKDVDISFGGTATSIAGYYPNRATSQDCPGSATSWGLFIDTSAKELTFYTPTAAATYVATGTPVQILIGTNANFQDAATQWITNPSSAGTYTISVGGTFNGSGTMLVSINAGVTVQATVAESLAFTVSSVKAVNCTADDSPSGGASAVDTSATTVAFGTISPNAFYIACNHLVVSTNAGDGYSITVQESSAMKAPSGKFIPDTTCDAGTCDQAPANAAAWSAGTHIGLGFTCFNQDNNQNCDSHYAGGTKFTQFANTAAGETPQQVMASSTAASVTGRIKYRLRVDNSIPAGAYSTVITYTIAATY